MASNIAPLAPGVLKCTFNQQYGNANSIMNRLFYTFSGTLALADGVALATVLGSAWETYIGPLVSTNYELLNITVTDLGSASGEQVVHPLDLVGITPTTGFLPAQTCMCLNGTINRRYRGGKPRWYQTGHNEAGLSDNQHFTANYVGNWQAAFLELATTPIGHAVTGGVVQNNVNLSLVEGYTWTEYTTSSGKVNYRKDPVYRTSAQTDIITNWTPLARISSQRKRGVN